MRSRKGMNWKSWLAGAMAVMMTMTAMPVGTVLAAQEEEQQQETENQETTGKNNISYTGRSLDFNSGWKFILKNVTEASDIQYDDSNWQNITLPHDWSIEQDFNPASKANAQGGYLDGGTGWYRKTFTLDESMKGKRVSIEFDGIMTVSTVYVNGEKLGSRFYGYSPYQYDITDYLKTDGSENVIAVKVTTAQPSSRWYTGSGIYRDVTLTITDSVHVDYNGMYVTTPSLEEDLKSGMAKVSAEATIVNSRKDSEKATVTEQILDADANIVAEKSTVQTLSEEKTKVKQELEVKNPHLWSTDDPYLYTAKTKITVDGTVVDEYETTFGMRYLTFTTDKGFYLNGQYTKLNGMCLHHDLGALGAATNERAVERQLQQMKAMGANAVRTAHNPASKVFIEKCNELGLMVVEESFDVWTKNKMGNDYSNYFKEHAEEDIKAMVDRDKNAPSVIMWCIGNEISYQSGDAEVAVNLNNWVKEIDTTRPTTINQRPKNVNSATSEKIMDTVDVVGFSYGSKELRQEWHKKHPEWVILNLEETSHVESRGVYIYPTEGAFDATMTNRTAQMDLENYQVSAYDLYGRERGPAHSETILEDLSLDFSLGTFIWTGVDYIGEPSPYAKESKTLADGTFLMPKSSYYGTVDTAGFEKDSYYLYQSQWTTEEKNPMVHLLPHWNWSTGEDVQVWAYSNCDAVELFVNGESLGKQEFKKNQTGLGVTYQTTEDGKLYLHWDTKFEAVEIEAVAYNESGDVVATDVIKTAGSAQKIKLTPDRRVICSDGQDLSYITAEVVDNKDVTVPEAMNQMEFEVTGGKIIGVDNGNAASTERYKSNKRKAFNGKALLIVASDGSGEDIKVTAKSSGLTDGTTTVYMDKGAAEINLLELLPVNVVTSVGTEPILPDSVTGVYSDGTEKQLSVIWDSVDPKKYAVSGTFTIEGKLENTNQKAFAKITVNDVIGVQPHTGMTVTGTAYKFPKTVNLIYSDGSKIQTNVTWDSVEDTAWNTEGIIRTEGKIEGSKYKAVATIRVAAEGSTAGNTALLANLKINGQDIEKFDENTTVYQVKLPYGNEKAEITAESKDNASVFVIPPVNYPGSYRILLQSEDGTKENTYTVNVEIEKPALKSVDLKLSAERIVEDQTYDLELEVTDQAGNTLKADDYEVVYESTDTSVVTVKEGTLYAVGSGTAQMIAKVTYNERVIASAPLTVKVESAGYEKKIVSFENVKIETNQHQAPALPKKVTANYDRGLSREIPVQWDTVKQEQYEKIGTFKVTGKVEGTSLKPEAEVVVKGIAAIENVSKVTLSKVAPELPGKVKVYWSDGTESVAKVTWDAIEKESYDSEGSFMAEGSVEGTTLKSEARIRVTDAYAEGTDLMTFRNDIYPKLSVSCKESSAEKIMDGVISEKNGERWDNYGSAYPEDVWIEYHFGFSEEAAYNLDQVSVNYYTDNYGAGLPNTAVFQYWNSKTQEWINVENQTAAANKVSSKRTDVTYKFDTVKTSRLRLNMSKKKTNGKGCIAIMEMSATAKEAVSNKTSLLSNISVNGQALDGFSPETMSYSYEYSGSVIPVITVETQDNAAATVIPTFDENGEIQIQVSSESGSDVSFSTYKIKLTRTDSGKGNEELEEIKKAAQEAAKTAEEAKENAQNAQADAVKAKDDAQKAETEAKAAQSKAEEAQKKAEEAQKTAKEAEETAKEAASQSGNSSHEAKAAQEKAELVKQAAEDAKSAAEIAREKAETAQNASMEARKQAQESQNAAETAEAGAQNAAKAAEAAEKAVQTAKTDAATAAEEAKKALQEAKEAKDLTETARKDAQNAAADAKTAKESCETAKIAAETAAANANAQAQLAEAAKTAAEAAAEKAETAKEQAEEAQKKAEEAQKKVEEALREAQILKQEMQEMHKDADFAQKKVFMKKVKSEKRSQITVNWKMVEEADGYTIQYAYNRKFKKAKTVKVSAKAKTRIKRLTGRKTCYVRIRAYKEKSTGEKIYTKYSAVKKAKVK